VALSQSCAVRDERRAEPQGSAHFLYESNQPALIDGGGDEALEQRVRFKRAGFQFGVVLDADEPWVVRIFDGFR
jgi:hypothetical protein